jgi:UDP-glucose 4-epimerase
MRKLAITGSSGYLGTVLVDHYRRRKDGIRILGLDVREPRGAAPDVFVQADVLSDELGHALASFEPDTIIHSAYILHPSSAGRRMRAINVDGCRNVLKAAAAVRARRLMILSSTTVCGAWPDNPAAIDDRLPVRPRPRYQYASQKGEVEKLTAEFAEAHPEMAVSWVRPCIVGGPGMDNYLKRLVISSPLFVLIDGHDTPLQFVHEQDVAGAIGAILDRDARGPFNLAPPDATTLSEIARATGRRPLRLPFWLVRAIAVPIRLFRRREDRLPRGFLDYIRYPWVAAPARLQDELGYIFRYGSAETLREIIANKH